MSGNFTQTYPRVLTEGIPGHFWEQFVLPVHVKDRLLWSPSNTGPLAVKDQVLTIHDLSVIEHPEWFAGFFSGWYRFLLPRLARRVRRLITVSEFTRGRLVELFGIPPDAISVIHEAASDSFHPSTREQIQAASKALGLPSASYLLAPGSMQPRKNLGRLLRAWSRVVEDLPESLWLILFGSQDQSHVFRKSSAHLLPARVHFTGHVPEVHLPALYSGALAFIYPSLYEGFGLPPLEAMACGTPVLASRAASMPEVLGDAGLMFDPLSVDSIADAIYSVAMDDSLRSDLKQRGLSRAAQFSWESAARQTWAVLQEVAGIL